MVVFENQTVIGDNSGTLPDHFAPGNYLILEKVAAVTVSAGGVIDGGYIFLSDEYLTKLTVTGNNSQVNAGELAIGNYGSGLLNIEDGGRVTVDGDTYIGHNTSFLVGEGGSYNFDFAPQSSGSVTVTGADSLLQSKSIYLGRKENTPGDFSGPPTPTSGTLTVSNGGKAIVDGGNGTIYIANASDSTGTLNIGAAAGQAAQAAGTLEAAEIAFGAGNGTMVFNHTDKAYAFDPKVSGAGSLIFSAGNTSLTGDYSGFTGSVTVNGGVLSANTKTLENQDILVNSGGTLGGTGSVGNVRLTSGALLAPGQLNAGDVRFESGSTYQVQVNASGPLSVLVAEGTVDIDKDATLSIIASDDGTYTPSTLYPVLLSLGGRHGEFGTVTDNLAFLDASVAYTDNFPTHFVQLTLNRATKSDNSLISFADLASSPNRKSVANAVEAAGAGTLHDAVQSMRTGETEQGFQALSGESHATMQGSLMSGADTGKSILTQRIIASTGGVGASSGDQVSMGFHGKDEVPMQDQINAQMWGQAFGGWGKVDATATTASSESYGGGFLTGFDAEIIEGWRTGLMAGYSRNQFNSSGNRSSGSADSYHIGAYAGTQMEALGLRFGASYTWHDLATRRDVAFTGFTDHLEADYNASTAQAFAEIGYAFHLAPVAFEPFAGIAIVNQHTDGFTETGGAAALTSGSSNDVMGVTTLGLRGEAPIGQFSGFTVSLNGSLAWRHAFGDVEPASTMRFASGGNSFAVTGAPIDNNTALFEAGLSLEKDTTLGLNVTYQGEVGASAQNHSGRLSLLYRF